MIMPKDSGYNNGFTDEDEKALLAFAKDAIHPQNCYHTCFWGTDHGVCNSHVLGHDFSEHLRTHHGIACSNKTSLKCRWDGCTTELKKESLIRHIQEKHLEWKYTCPNCSVRFTRNYTRDQHVTREHSS